jgi:holo-[acyl-carrier protein] synthase
MKFEPDLDCTHCAAMPVPARMGFDLVQISAIAQSLDSFGSAFTERLFTPHELAYAHSGRGMCAQRLAARFAAKEALIKALRLSEAGVSWRDIEVVKHGDGDCGLALHGRVAEMAAAMGVSQLSLSLSHDGDYAGAIVAALFDPFSQHSLEASP